MASKSLHLFSKYRDHRSGKRRTNERTDGRTRREHNTSACLPVRFPWQTYEKLHSTPPLGEFPSEYRHPLWYGKTRMVSLPDGGKFSKICLFVLTWSTNVTDGQTDRQTPHDSVDRACIASRGKKLRSAHRERRRRRYWHATLRLRSRHHPPQTAVLTLSQICCFRERKVVLFQILLDGAEHREQWTSSFCLTVWRWLSMSLENMSARSFKRNDRISRLYS